MRSLVLLLVGLPLLMPPGMCVCQLVPCGSTQAPPVVSVTAPTQPAPDACCCTKRASSTPPTSGEQAAARPRPAPHRHHPAAPDSDEHLPGCPAASGAIAEARVTLPPAPVYFHLDPFTVPVVFLPDVSSGRSPAREQPQHVPSAPIFIAQCTLLI